MGILARLHRDYALVFSFFTRLPTKFPDSAKGVPLAEAGWAIPLTGLVVALLAGIAQTAGFIGAPTIVIAVLALLAVVLLTGALHEDGLADSADGLGGGSTVERKLEIMRDSSVGTYGMIAVCLSLITRIAFLTAILSLENSPPLFVVLALALVFSRVMILIALSSPGEVRAPQAATGGKSLGASAGTANAWMVIPWIAALATANFWLANLSFIMVLAVLPPLGFYLYAKEKLGGVTGDIYGAIEQIAQISFLACLLWYLT